MILGRILESVPSVQLGRDEVDKGLDAEGDGKRLQRRGLLVRGHVSHQRQILHQPAALRCLLILSAKTFEVKALCVDSTKDDSALRASSGAHRPAALSWLEVPVRNASGCLGRKMFDT